MKKPYFPFKLLIIWCLFFLKKQKHTIKILLHKIFRNSGKKKAVLKTLPFFIL